MCRARSDESLILSFHIMPVDTVYEQVFCFFNLQCVGFASCIPFIMYYLYCVTSTRQQSQDFMCKFMCCLAGHFSSPAYI